MPHRSLLPIRFIMRRAVATSAPRSVSNRFRSLVSLDHIVPSKDFNITSTPPISTVFKKTCLPIVNHCSGLRAERRIDRRRTTHKPKHPAIREEASNPRVVTSRDYQPGPQPATELTRERRFRRDQTPAGRELLRALTLREYLKLLRSLQSIRLQASARSPRPPAPRQDSGRCRLQSAFSKSGRSCFSDRPTKISRIPTAKLRPSAC